MRPDAVIEALHFEALGTTCGLFGVDVTGAQLADGEQWVREMGARQTRAHLTDPLLPVCKLRPRDVHAEQAARSPQSLEVKRLDDGVRTHRWTSPAAHRPGARRVQT